MNTRYISTLLLLALAFLLCTAIEVRDGSSSQKVVVSSPCPRESLSPCDVMSSKGQCFRLR